MLVAKRRPFRLAESIKEEVSKIIREDMKDPRLGFVTVTDVEVSEDLRHAKIFVSILGEEENVKSGMEVLSGASGYIRSELGKTLTLRFIPEIVFKYDHSIEHGAHISKLLREVGVKGDPSDTEDN